MEKEFEEHKSKEAIIEKSSPEAEVESLSKVKPVKNMEVIKKSVINDEDMFEWNMCIFLFWK